MKVTRSRRKVTPEEWRDHQQREYAALLAVAAGMVIEAVGYVRVLRWPSVFSVVLYVWAAWVYFHVSVSIEVPVLKRWQERRRERRQR